jgi:hypothetical protein
MKKRFREDNSKVSRKELEDEVENKVEETRTKKLSENINEENILNKLKSQNKQRRILLSKNLK